MKTIHKITLLGLLSSSTLLANPIDSIGLNIGTQKSDYKQTNNQGVILLGNTPDESFNSYEIYTTLNPILDTCKTYNMKPYIGYTYSSNSELKHQYLLAGINKYYTPSNYKVELYAGVLVGYGQMDWKYDPLNSSSSKNVDANSFIAGIQLGANYPINEKYSIGLNTKYLMHNYETDLNPSAGVSSTIEHKDTISLSLGVKYLF
jgi:hypothetical protein